MSLCYYKQVILCRYVPFAAVAAANAINIPMMRSTELSNGIPVRTESGELVGDSKIAARSAITQVHNKLWAVYEYQYDLHLKLPSY